jgi:hypothetical protein
MAMLPEYYPGLPEDPYMEYLRKLGQFQRSSTDLPYTSLTNLRIENQYPGVRQMPRLDDDPVEVMNRNRPVAQSSRLGTQFPAAYSESPVPSTTEMMRARDTLNQDADRRADVMIAEAQQRRSRPQPVQPITPSSMGAPPSTGNVSLPARPQTPAVPTQSAPAQGGGLLDVDTDFFDDPTRMGLLQAGLGLMSAPRYSTNPNDVTLGSALARGLGGFVQGYGGTKKRLSEAERQKLEDEYKRSQIEFDKLYKTALTNEAIGRTEHMKNLLAKPAKDQEEWEAKVREIYPNPDNKTGQALIAAGPVEGAKKLAKLAGGMTETERTGLVSKIKNDTVLSADDKTMLLEMVSERDYEGKLSNSTAAITQVINQIKDDLKPKTETKPTEGQKLREDLERVFIYDPTTGERKIDEVYRNSPEYRKGIDQHLDSLQSSVSVGGVGTFEKPRYPLPDGIKWGVDLATPGRKVTDLGSFVQVEGLGDNQEKINSSFATLNKLQKLQNKLVEYGKPELAERLTKKDPKVRELVSDYYDLLLTLKDEYNLGVLTGNDEQIIKSVIADPTSVDLSNFFSGLDTFVASLNSVKKSVIDNLRPVASQYNIDIMDQYNAIPGYRPLTFDPISVVPPDNDSAGYNSEAKSILQEIQTDVGPQEDPNMWNPLNWFNNN